MSFDKITTIVDALLGHDSIKTIFEFGSRYGEDTIQFAKHFPAATIYAFECNPQTLPNCRKKTARYSNIILTEKAVSNEDGYVTFYPIDEKKTKTTWVDGNQGASSLFRASGKYPVETYIQKEVKVEATTLHSFMLEKKLDCIDFIWMDVQGAELMALQGLKEKLANVKLMQLEVEFMDIYQDQPLFDEIKAFLLKNNFTFVGFTTKSRYAADAVFSNNNYIPASILNTRLIKNYLGV